MPIRTGRSASCSSFGAPYSASSAVPSQIGEMERSRLRAPTSSCTAGLCCSDAASCGKWRTFTSGGSLCVGPARGQGLERHAALREPPIVRGQRPGEDRAGPDAGIGEAVEPERARHPDRAELLREALHPAAREREVAIDPDVRAGRDVPAVEHRVHDDEELVVLAARGIEQLPAVLGAALPVDEQRGGASGIVGKGSTPAAARRRPRRDRPSTRARGSRRRSATAVPGRAMPVLRASGAASSPSDQPCGGSSCVVRVLAPLPVGDGAREPRALASLQRGEHRRRAVGPSAATSTSSHSSAVTASPSDAGSARVPALAGSRPRSMPSRPAARIAAISRYGFADASAARISTRVARPRSDGMRR